MFPPIPCKLCGNLAEGALENEDGPLPLCLECRAEVQELVAGILKAAADGARLVAEALRVADVLGLLSEALGRLAEVEQAGMGEQGTGQAAEGEKT